MTEQLSEGRSSATRPMSWPGPTPLVDVISAFLQERSGRLRRGSVLGYASDLRHLCLNLAKVLGREDSRSITLDECTTEALLQAFVGLQQVGRSGRRSDEATSRAYAVWHALFDFAAQGEPLIRNPLDGLSSRGEVCLEESTLQAAASGAVLAEGIAWPSRDVLLVGLLSSPRLGPSDLMTMVPEIFKSDGHSWWVELPEAGGRSRAVPLLRETATALGQYIPERRQVLRVAPSPLLLDRDGYPLSRRQISYYAARIRRAAALLERPGAA